MYKVLDKVIFCFKISSGLLSFIKLIWNSKRFRWSKTEEPFLDSYPYKTASYHFKIGNRKRRVSMRTFAGDIDIFYEIFHREVYKTDPAFFKDGNIIFDLGANSGLAAVYFLGKSPQAKIICAEPDPENFQILQRNLAKEINEGSVFAEEAAVMPEDGMVFLHRDKIKYNSKISENTSETNTKAISINTLLKKYGIARINLLKIDIEGSEKLLFSRNTEWLSQTDHIILEFHSDEDHRVVLASLQQYNFKIMFLKEEKNGSAGLLYAAAVK